MNKKIDKAVALSAYGLFVMPILPKTASIIAIAIFLILSILSFILSKKRTFNNRFFFATSLVYFIYLFSITYSDNMPYTFKKLVTALPLLLLPFSLSLLSTETVELIRMHLKNYLKTYVASIIIAISITVLINYNHLGSINELQDYIFKNETFLKIDALYLSLHIAIALVCSVYLYFISQKLWKAIAATVVITVLFITLLFLSFKSAIIAFVVAFGLYALMVNKTKLWALFMSSTIIVIGLLTFSPYFNKKFNQLLIVKNANNLEYIEIKETIQSCSVKLIPEAGFFGFGLGDGKHELINCYSGKSEMLKTASYNSHNQYLSLLLNVGIIGLVLFGCTMLILLFTGLNRKNFLGISMLVLFSVFMLSENILERQQGVVYFSIFIYFLFFINFNKPSKIKSILTQAEVIASLKND